MLDCRFVIADIQASGDVGRARSKPVIGGALLLSFARQPSLSKCSHSRLAILISDQLIGLELRQVSTNFAPGWLS